MCVVDASAVSLLLSINVIAITVTISRRMAKKYEIMSQYKQQLSLSIVDRAMAKALNSPPQ